jgi:predicted transcriptional regulator of viral defense system
VLFENNILTENVYTFTLITTKKTKHFTNNFGDFNYKSIKKDFFGDYEILKIDDFLIYKATPEKALFDYLYFKR